MKNILVLLLIGLVMIACKGEAKVDTNAEDTQSSEAKKIELIDGKTSIQNDGLKTFSGQFIYFADAAVLQTKGSIYGVVINDKMHELNEMAKPFKKEATDYVSVQVRGKLLPKPKVEEGWPFNIDIKEIQVVKAYEAKDNEVIKLGNSESK